MEAEGCASPKSKFLGGNVTLKKTLGISQTIAREFYFPLAARPSVTLPLLYSFPGRESHLHNINVRLCGANRGVLAERGTEGRSSREVGQTDKRTASEELRSKGEGRRDEKRPGGGIQHGKSLDTTLVSQVLCIRFLFHGSFYNCRILSTREHSNLIRTSLRAGFSAVSRNYFPAPKCASLSLQRTTNRCLSNPLYPLSFFCLFSFVTLFIR